MFFVPMLIYFYHLDYIDILMYLVSISISNDRTLYNTNFAKRPLFSQSPQCSYNLTRQYTRITFLLRKKVSMPENLDKPSFTLICGSSPNSVGSRASKRFRKSDFGSSRAISSVIEVEFLSWAS